MQLILEHFTPDNKEDDDTELHRLARAQALEPADTDDDTDFTVEETRNAVASMDKKESAGLRRYNWRSVQKCLRGLPQRYNCHVQRLPAKRSLQRDGRLQS
jgi:hypothetical protein